MLRILKDATLELGGRYYSGAYRVAGRHGLAKRFVVLPGDGQWVWSTISRAIRQQLGHRYSFGPSLLGPALRRGTRDSIVHFLSPGAYLGRSLYGGIHKSNRQVVNWTHGQRRADQFDPSADRMLDNVREASDYVDRVIVQSQVGFDTLSQEGMDTSKMVRIPLGIDTHLFRPPSDVERAHIREELEIPQTAYCIGSFQRDGIGGAEGPLPKLVKGPDVFLEVIQRLSRNHEICVLLTGPARGYVKDGLDRMDVPYRHVYLKDYQDVARHFWSLDAYVIASRDEGGPMALLEAMASGVPLVSTRVGMCIDLIEDGSNAFLADVEDAGHLAERAAEVRENAGLRQSLIQNGLATAQSHNWGSIARRYDEEVYLPLTNGNDP